MKYLILQTVILIVVMGCGHRDKADAVEEFKLLEKSKCFRVGPVDEAGIIPPEQIALCRIMKQDNASTMLEELYSTGSPAGKLYALLGLRFVNRAKYEELVPQLKQKTYKVHAQAGCNLFEETVQAIVESMESGNYDYHIQRELKSS